VNGDSETTAIVAPVVMYATGMCPYCVQAERLLRAKGVTEIAKVRVDLEPARRVEMMEKTGRRTVRRSTLATRTSAATTTWSRSNTPASSARCSRRRNAGPRRFARPRRRDRFRG